MAQSVSLPPRAAPSIKTPDAEPAVDTSTATPTAAPTAPADGGGKIGLDGSEIKPTGWSASQAANEQLNADKQKPVPYSRKVDMTGDLLLGVVGGALNDRRAAAAAGQPANQSLSNLIPNISHPRADFSGYGLGTGGASLSSPEGKANAMHNAVHIGIGTGVYLFERARGATKTEAAIGSALTGVGIELGQSLQKLQGAGNGHDAGRFDVSDVVRTASGALVGMGIESAVGAMTKDKTGNPLYNIVSHITAFDIGKDSQGKTKVNVAAHWQF